MTDLEDYIIPYVCMTEEECNGLTTNQIIEILKKKRIDKDDEFDDEFDEDDVYGIRTKDDGNRYLIDLTAIFFNCVYQSKNIDLARKVLKEAKDLGTLIDIDYLGDGTYESDAMHHVITYDNYEQWVDLFLEYGADINFKNEYGATALFDLLECPDGLRIDMEYKEEKNKLKRELNVVKYLLEKKADVNCTAMTPAYSTDERHVKREYSLLQCVVKHYDIDMVKLLINHGADVNYISKCGRNMLFATSDKVVRHFVNLGLDVNKKDMYGYTPLHYAARHGSVTTCKILVNKGADVFFKNMYGETPRNVAQWHDNKDICSYLTKIMTRRRNKTKRLQNIKPKSKTIRNRITLLDRMIIEQSMKIHKKESN